MTVKKDRDYDKPFTPPKVTVSIVEPGSRLDLATKALTEQNTTATRAEQTELDKYRDSLAGEISAAKAGLGALSVWEKANGRDLRLLRSLSFDGARGVAEESLRVSAKNRVKGLFHTIARTREVLSTAETRVTSLIPGDLEGPRMHSDAPGIRSYGELPPAAVEHIRLDVQRASRTVVSLDNILAEAQGAVTRLADNLAKKTRVNDRARGAEKSTAVAIDPDLLRERAAANPNVPAQTSYGNFSGYATDNKKN